MAAAAQQPFSDTVALITLLGAVRAYAAHGEIAAASVNRTLQDLAARATAAEATVARLEAQNEELRRALAVSMGRLPPPAAPAEPQPAIPEPAPPAPPAPAQPDPSKRRRGRPRRQPVEEVE